jgi:choline dehydrogenase
MTIDVSPSRGVQLALLQSDLMDKRLAFQDFVAAAGALGVPPDAAGADAERFLAVTANQSRRRASLMPRYDYIVVGAGAAGAVVASRLARDPAVTVLLLEAGASTDLQPWVLATEAWFMNIGGALDWSFSAVPGAGVNNRRLHQAAGRLLGGGTSINGMVWARGHQHDFDHWEKETGDARWGYRHVVDTYRRIEDWHGTPDPLRRGVGGEVFVQAVPDPHPLASAFLAAAAARGIPTFPDQNGALLEGAGGGALTNVRIRDGRRRNVAADYLYPLMHQPNLTVLPGAPANRLLFAGGDARSVRGIEFEWRGQVHRVDAVAEVILSAGALQTPKLLMLSGIGDRADLQRAGITPTTHLPGVGRNFQDHPIVGAGLWEPHAPIVARNNAAEANLFVKSRPELPTPDLHLWNIEAPYLSEVTMAHAVPGAWSISPGLVRPESRGHVRLASADPRAPLEIHANMLDDARDLEALREGLRLARELGNSMEMRAFVKREILPGPVTGEARDDLIRNAATSMHHPAGTAKMGRDDLSVVDAELRVHGVAGLRVADASVMPSITTGNTQAPSVLIGERLGELLTH